MNYYLPRQVDPKAERPDAGKWRYTCMNDGKVWPVGYCTDCPGHETEQEARQHYTDYELNETLNLDGEYADQQLRCEARLSLGLAGPDAPKCGAWTNRFASLGPGRMVSFTLCDKHRNRENVADLYGTVGNIASSY